jgi:hypothetical protein
MRKLKKYVNKERWETGLVKFVLDYSHVDAWELERFGYKNLKLHVRIDILKKLIEAQFDLNAKFKAEINNIESLLLRLVPIGRDLNGNQYWYHLDEEHTLRIYREQPNLDRSWSLICENKDQFLDLIANVEQENTLVSKIEIEEIIREEPKVEEDSEKEEECDPETEPEESEIPQPQFTVLKQEKLVKSERNEDVGKVTDDSTQSKSLLKQLDKEDNVTTHHNDKDDIEILRQLLSELCDKVAQDCEAIITDVPNTVNAEFPSESPKTKIIETTSSTKKRGRKRKGLLAELDIDVPPIIDTTPIKRSSRIQALQEKRNAQLKVQMEIEQRRLEARAKNDDERKRKKAEVDSLVLAKFLEGHQDTEDEEPEEDEDDSEEEEKKRKRRKRKGNRSSDSEFEISQIKLDKRKGKKGRRRKLKTKAKLTWSSNEEHDEDEDHEDDFDDHIDEEEEVLNFEDNADEFACEELDPDEEPVILKRARTAKKIKEENEAAEVVVNDDTPCQKCGLYTDAEWILLCDHCDHGYHTHCLLPPLHFIPEGDWYCPKCENKQLLEKLQFEFEHYVSNLAKREREQLRKERLKHVAINIGNIIHDENLGRVPKKSKARADSNDDDEDDAGSISQHSSSNSADESRHRPIKSIKLKSKIKRRTSDSEESADPSEASDDEDGQDSDEDGGRVRNARKRVSYQFKEYDELINKAIQGSDYDAYEDEDPEDEDDEDSDKPAEDEEESDDGKSPFSKGKDISNLVKLDKGDLFDENAKSSNCIESNVKVSLKESDAESERVVKVKSSSVKRKSKRKLNDLDSPDDDPEEDSDFSIHGSSQTEVGDSDETEENADDSNASEEDDDGNSDLSDWRTSKRSSRKKVVTKKRSKRRGRYDSSDEDDDDSDYRSRNKRSRASKKVSYKEVSSTELDDDGDESYSDSSVKLKKKTSKGKSKVRKSKREDTDFSASGTEEEDDYVAPRPNRRHSDDNFVDDESDDDDERRLLPKSKVTIKKKAIKSKRTVKKKVYKDASDGDETESNGDSTDESDQEYKAKSVTKKNRSKVDPTQSKAVDTEKTVSDQDKPSLKMSLRQKRTYSRLSESSRLSAENGDHDISLPTESSNTTIQNEKAFEIKPTSQSIEASPLKALTAFAMPGETIKKSGTTSNSSSLRASKDAINEPHTLPYTMSSFVANNGQADLMGIPPNPLHSSALMSHPYPSVTHSSLPPVTLMSSFSPPKMTSIACSSQPSPHPPIVTSHAPPTIDLPSHLASLPPHLASQLATQHQQQLASHLAGGFAPISNYPPHFYDPAFAYFGHPVPHPAAHGLPPHPSVSAAAAYHSQMVASSYHSHHSNYVHPPSHPPPPPPHPSLHQPHVSTSHLQHLPPQLPPSAQLPLHAHSHLPPPSHHPPVSASQIVTTVSANSSKLPNR